MKSKDVWLNGGNLKHDTKGVEHCIAFSSGVLSCQSRRLENVSREPGMIESYVSQWRRISVMMSINSFLLLKFASDPCGTASRSIQGKLTPWHSVAGHTGVSHVVRPHWVKANDCK